MNTVLKDLIGEQVRVWSGEQGLSDEGTLEGFDHPWLRIRKADGEVLCFSAYLVRLVKLVNRAESDHHVVAV